MEMKFFELATILLLLFPLCQSQAQGIDSDGDGTPNYQDLDSDDGGVSDETENRLHETDPTDPQDDGIGWPDGPLSGGTVGCSHTPSSLHFVWFCVLAVLAVRRPVR